MSRALPLRAFVAGISEYDDKLLKNLPAAKKDATDMENALLPLGFKSVKKLHGRVTCENLRRRMEEFVNAVTEDVAKIESPENPVLFCYFSCHGVQRLKEEYPILCGSDSQPLQAVDFDVREELVHRLNRILAPRGILTAIIVFDCCLENKADTCFTFKGSTTLPSLRNDFFFLYACDPGRRATATASGSILTQKLIPLLPYHLKITDIFAEAISQVVKDPISMQRPWQRSRSSDPDLVPVLGKETPTTSLLGASRGTSECSTFVGEGEDDVSFANSMHQSIDSARQSLQVGLAEPEEARQRRGARCKRLCGTDVILSLLFLLLAVFSIAVRMATPCRLGDWVDDGSCSVTCGGIGKLPRRRDVEREAGPWSFRCPSKGSEERRAEVPCIAPACPSPVLAGPAGCCRMCDLRCKRRICETVVDLDQNSRTCVFDDVAQMLGNGVLITWYGKVDDHSVKWRWRFSAHGIHFLKERKRMVELVDTTTGWRCEHGDYTYGWDEATRRSLGEFARHLGFDVNTSAFVSEQVAALAMRIGV